MILNAHSIHTDNLKGGTRVRRRIDEHKEAAVGSTGQELVELVLILLVVWESV